MFDEPGFCKESKAQKNMPFEIAYHDNWTWNETDKSHEVVLRGRRQRTACFHPHTSHGTAGVRGTKTLNGGRYYWEINVLLPIFGTSMMFGIGTKKVQLHVDDYVNMLGEDEHGWGLSHKGLLWHNGQMRQYTDPFRENKATTVGLHFDGIEGTLTYYKDNVCLGVAFTGLNSVKEGLYPIICSTAARSRMCLSLTACEFGNLQDRCRALILKLIQNENDVQKLHIPSCLKSFILEGMGHANVEKKFVKLIFLRKFQLLYFLTTREIFLQNLIIHS